MPLDELVCGLELLPHSLDHLLEQNCEQNMILRFQRQDTQDHSCMCRSIPRPIEQFNYKIFMNNHTRISMDVDDFQECIHSDNKIREDSILKNWISRMNNQTMLAKSFQQQLKCQMAIMRVKFPFLDESQLRGQALKNLNIPSICGQIPTLVKIIQLGSPKGKEDLLQLASYIHPKKMQCRNRKRSEIKSNDKAGLLTHNRKCRQEIENITSKTSNMIMSNASCPGGSHMTLIPKRRNKCNSQKKTPQIYQDLEDTSELEGSQNNFDKHEESKNHENIHNVVKHNVKTKTIKHNLRKLNENKENIQIKTHISNKIQEYDPQLKVKEILDSEDLGKCNSMKRRRKISSSQNNAPKLNIKKIKNFPGNCPQIHSESETHKTQHLPKSVKNISNNYKKGKVNSKRPVLKTKQDTNKQRTKTKNTFNQHMQQLKNVPETQIRKSISISKQLDSISDEKLIEKSKPKRTARNSSFTQKEKNQGNLRISKLPRNVDINPLKTLEDINYKEKFMNNPSDNAKNKKDTGINENSKHYNKQKLKPKNMNLDIASQYTTDNDKSNSTESDSKELAQLSDNVRNLSKHKEQLKNHQFERDRKATTYCKQINTIRLTTKNQCNYPNPLKVNDDFIMGQSETFKIPRSSTGTKTKDHICYRKKIFELNISESINNEAEKYVEEIPESVFSISDEDGNTQMNVQNGNSKGKKKTVKKRKLFYNSTSRRKTYQDITSSSEFEESDYNAGSNLSVCNTHENIQENKSKQNLCLTNQKQRCQDLKKSIKNMERGKIFTTSICEIDRCQDKQSSVDLVGFETNEKSNLSGNITDENEQKSRNSKMLLNTPEDTDHESNQLPLHSPVDYAFLDSFSSSEESNKATQEALKILTDDLLNYDIESSKKKYHSATYNVSSNQQDQIIMPTSCKASSEIFSYSSGKNSDFLPSNSTQSSNFNLEDNDGINISDEGDYLADLFDPVSQTDKFFYYIRPEKNDDDDEAEESCTTLLDEF